MSKNIEIARSIGYMKFSDEAVQDIKKYNKQKDENVLIITTGSQGESLSAMTRIAMGSHPHIKVKKGDTIVFSSSPIIGNERAITAVINNLCIQGAKVIHNDIMDVHTSGHAKREELKQMIDLVKPKYFIPIHGEYYMRQAHAQLAHEKCGIPEDRIIMIQNGDVLYAENGRVYKSAETVETKYILIDGSGEGQSDSPVLLERGMMSKNGALVVLIYIKKKTGKLVRDPDVVSRGFIYMHETEEITREITHVAAEAYRNIQKKNPGASRKDIKKYIKQTVDRYTTNKLERRPLVIPLIVES